VENIYLHNNTPLSLTSSDVIKDEGTIGANTGEHRRFGRIEAYSCYGLSRGRECDIHHGSAPKDNEKGKMPGQRGALCLIPYLDYG
jgi:hypothetical protein